MYILLKQNNKKTHTKVSIDKKVQAHTIVFGFKLINKHKYYKLNKWLKERGVRKKCMCKKYSFFDSDL